MPLTKLQFHILGLLAASRSPDSYVAGGSAINRDGPRFSSDIDIFHDCDERLAAIAAADAATIKAAGLDLSWLRSRGSERTALIAGLDEHTQLEWVADSDFRFFPTARDPLFGYVLHPVDLATNKAAAASDRRVPRDIVDLVTLHKQILPLGAVITAAVGRFPGMTPEQMLVDIRRHSTFTMDEFQALAVDAPLDIQKLHGAIKAMLASAEVFIRDISSDAVGFLFLEGDKPVQPNLAALDRYRRHSGARRGHWPSSSQIGTAMLERYRNES
ncbi:nucleotidyl transferase AbiEii/AbiGii toxin family protein [Beijerinckia sp. L45]|uniref:nucleotidyl transferase AbiEii/AbiGii toxin family protein n=1 Tax=Beijerinckia sp. L45 TaxID=1641855 RepID=UPI00131E72F8|nr:nucleotidyl transferase AbiEii/AbiGii toxin family protein [Beijerinckia sp. L45]